MRDLQNFKIQNRAIINSTTKQILHWSQLQAFADNKINMTEKKKSKFDLERVESILGKGENAGYQHFFLFQQCFQKASFALSSKVGIGW